MGGGGGKSYSPPAPVAAPPVTPETDGTSKEQETAKLDEEARRKLLMGRQATLINGAQGQTGTALTSTPTLIGGGTAAAQNSGTTT